MPEHPFFQHLSQKLNLQKQQGLARSIHAVTQRQGSSLVIDNQEYLDFTSNDFLGLGRNAQLASKMALLIKDNVGAGASRLVTGTSQATLDAEKALAQYFGYASCLIFSSGFLANLTLLATLFSPKETLMVDKRVHASTWAGVHQSGAQFHSFKHNNMMHLEKILGQHPCTAVLTESLFSMDGDSPLWSTLKKLKNQFQFLTLVDEAHAFGVLGPGGQGLASGLADIAVGTLGKAFGLFGAFVLGPTTLRHYLLQFAQGIIYTTALPPWHGHMTLAMVEQVAQAHEQREYLQDLASRAQELLKTTGLKIQGDHHILTLAMDSEAACIHFCTALQRQGILVLGARYPTVPWGQARLRICLSSIHTWTDLVQLRDALMTIIKDQ